MLSTGLVAIDSTVVATAVPSIVSSLGGFTEFPWLFSVYLLAQAVTVPVYGKLADVFGRKPVMLVYRGEGFCLVKSAEGAQGKRILRQGDLVVSTSQTLTDGMLLPDS